MSESYCIRCKGKTEVKNGEIIYYKNGVPAEKGVCSKCGSKVLRILYKHERLGLKKPDTGEQTI